MVARGKFFLYDSYLPALSAGAYQLKSEMDLFTNSSTTADNETDVAAHTTHLNVTAPRYKLPPDQALMTFPPANSEGAYENRLPQIVLKRRTLPWDRDAAPTGTSINGQNVEEETPWLALVVIAEGEGTIEHDVPVAECVTSGVTLAGNADVATATRLSMSHSTVQSVFPTIDDLIMLTHVREVNLDDTEAAMGDDDGFLSVVVANRMPQFDRENCRPKAYTACLVNLEGQLDKLPLPTPPRDFFNITDLHLSDVQAVVAKAVTSGNPVPIRPVERERILDSTNGLAIMEAIRRGEVVLHDGHLIDQAGVIAGGLTDLGRIDRISLLDGEFSRLENSASLDGFAEIPAGTKAPQIAGVFGGFEFPLEVLGNEPMLRFPVLTSWRFTCAGAGGFESIMRNLDVGLLGATTPGGYQRPQADCVPEETGEGPGSPPPARIPLEVSETGHIRLPHQTRTGSKESAWYRGPFSPHRLMRRVIADENDNRPVLAHVSDHLRMMTPQGQQDVSLAIAFETGRLLAMSQPSFVASLMRWRAQSYGADLTRTKLKQGVQADRLLQLLPGFNLEALLVTGKVAEAMEAEIFAELNKHRAGAICPSAPLVTAGLEIAALAGPPLDHMTVGLGLNASLASQLEGLGAQLIQPEDLSVVLGQSPDILARDALTQTTKLNQQLGETLDRGLRDLAELAVGKEPLESGELKDIEVFDDFRDFLDQRLKDKGDLK